MKIKAVRGTKDILPEDSAIWQIVEEQAKNLCEFYGYQEIRTPILEEAQLFTRSIGKSSDIVRKEMYSFLDRKKRLLCLRPEATASVVRAYLESGLDKCAGLAKFYYLGPMFRAERPQAGRLRQFHHLGVEAIGTNSPFIDAEVIMLAVNILRRLKINEFTLQLNSIGCQNDRTNYKLLLRSTLQKNLKQLCSDCQNRYQINLLRIFDCKRSECKEITQRLPLIKDYLCLDCTTHFNVLKQILDTLQLSYKLNAHLVRGLDYYTKTCFEIVHPHLGAQNAIGAGGRYDNLVADLGGPSRPAIGFALGLERMIAVSVRLDQDAEQQSRPYIYVATLGEQAAHLGFNILSLIREQGIRAEMNFQQQSLKGQMRLANRLGFKFVVILGEMELKKNTVLLRDMQKKQQAEIKISELAKELKKIIS